MNNIHNKDNINQVTQTNVLLLCKGEVLCDQYKIKHTERDCLIEVHGHACFISIVGAMVFRPSENDISFNPKFFRDSDAYSKLIKRKIKAGY